MNERIIRAARHHESEPNGARASLLALFDAAVKAAKPDLCVPQHLPSPPRGRTVVAGAGKTAAAMARAVESNWSSQLAGFVVTRYGHAVECREIIVAEARRPVPDSSAVKSAERILLLTNDLGPDDLLIFLVSGGGSSLLSLPFCCEQGSGCVRLEEKQEICKSLLMSGANIGDMNTVRKHLSSIKGGRLAAAAYPTRVVTLAISDVPGDDPSIIGSGPTVADPTTCDDAIAVLRKHHISTSD